MSEMRPMLACPAPTDGIDFPVYASAKIDGIRCVVKDAVAYTRKLEPIPNLYVQSMLGHSLLNGLDGELCVGPPYSDTLFNDTQSGIMSVHGKPDFMFHVFDFWNGPEGMGYGDRYIKLLEVFSAEPYTLHPRMEVLEQHIVNNMDELTLMQEDYLERGYEGLILRDIDGPYKFGRSTPKQGWMMKLKKFASGEAVVIGAVELMINENELEEDALGLAKRSSAKDGLRPGGVLGSLRVKDCETGVEFGIGSGFTAEQRAQFWEWHLAGKLVGLIAKYKHFEIGTKDAPRFPIFLGWRDPRDMGAPA